MGGNIDTLVRTEHGLVLTSAFIQVVFVTGVTRDAHLVVGLAVEAVCGLTRNYGPQSRVDTLVNAKHGLSFTGDSIQVEAVSCVTCQANLIVSFTIKTVGTLTCDNETNC